MNDEVTLARMALLDALEALELHREALVIIGAQAVYLHTGATKIALAEFTTDGDVVVDPHNSKSMRRTRGIEAALIDNSKMVIGARDPAVDPREFEVSVAGPAALLVAKLHKIHDRIDSPSRRDNKDAHDVYRLLRAVETQVFVAAIERLLHEGVSADVTREAIIQLDELFGNGAAARGSLMAGAAEELVGDPTAVSESVALLAEDLLAALER